MVPGRVRGAGKGEQHQSQQVLCHVAFPVQSRKRGNRLEVDQIQAISARASGGCFTEKQEPSQDK
jgi:hypothetical protein